ncbi:hypothetical protein FPRO04_12744 [Fusarium proliferatum]|nr:hypothetical protein FPRO04_12744 [Fusarium proliferatum]
MHSPLASDTATTTSIASTTQPTTAAEETSTVVSSKAFTEANTTTTIATISSDTTTAVTSDNETTPATDITTADITTTTTSEAKITTTTETTTATSEPESTTTTEATTTAEATTTTSGAKSTTTAPIATPTFTIVGGSGSVNGASLKAPANKARKWYFQTAETSLPRPLSSIPTSAEFYQYLNCQVMAGKLACTAPKSQCIMDGNGNVLGCLTVPDSGLPSDVNSQFYYQYMSGSGDYLYVSTGSPSGYKSTDLIAQEA